MNTIINNIEHLGSGEGDQFILSQIAEVKNHIIFFKKYLLLISSQQIMMRNTDVIRFGGQMVAPLRPIFEKC